LPWIGAEALDPFGIPEMMQVAGPEAISDDGFPIATSIAIVGGMKGLMEVAGQMQDEFQRDEPFFRIGVRVGEFGGELLDFIDDASLRQAIRGNRAAGSGGWLKQAVSRFGSASSTSTKCHCRVCS
jgi:hypothetical protein